MVVRVNSNRSTAIRPKVRITSWNRAATAPRPNCNSKRNQMKTSMSRIAAPSARIPLRNSSPETFGPTTSARVNFTCPKACVRAAFTRSAVPEASAPSGVWNRTWAAP